MAQQTPLDLIGVQAGSVPFSGQPMRVKWEPPSYVEMFKRGLQLAQSMIPPGTRTLESKLREAEMTGYYEGKPTVELQRLLEEKRYHDLWAQIQREQIAARSSGSTSDLLEYILGQTAGERSQRATASTLSYLNQTYDAFAQRLKNARERATSAKNPKEKAKAQEEARKLSYPLLDTLITAFRDPRIQEDVTYNGADLAVAIDGLVRRVARKSADAYFLDLIRDLKAKGDFNAALAAADLASAYLSAKSMSALKGASQNIEILLWSEINSMRGTAKSQKARPKTSPQTSSWRGLVF